MGENIVKNEISTDTNLHANWKQRHKYFPYFVVKFNFDESKHLSCFYHLNDTIVHVEVQQTLNLNPALRKDWKHCTFMSLIVPWALMHKSKKFGHSKTAAFNTPQIFTVWFYHAMLCVRKMQTGWQCGHRPDCSLRVVHCLPTPIVRIL